MGANSISEWLPGSLCVGTLFRVIWPLLLHSFDSSSYLTSSSITNLPGCSLLRHQYSARMSALNFPLSFQSCLRSHLSCVPSLGLSSSITSSLLFITYRVVFKILTLYSNSLYIRLPLQLGIILPSVGIWGLVLYFDHLT